MRILIGHNKYQMQGGEDSVYQAEVALLRRAGTEVIELLADNRLITPRSKYAVAWNCVWSTKYYNIVRTTLKSQPVSLCHFHNTFPLLSPAVYFAASSCSVPVVQTLHNYRLICPGATLTRRATTCEECVGKSIALPAVAHGCYRNSRLATACLGAMLLTHGLLKTWKRRVSLFVALSEYARQKFIQGGLPAERIVVKPNFVHPDPGMAHGDGSYVLFVGRLTEEKGVKTLLDAWQRVHGGVRLMVAGDGPLRKDVLNATERLKGLDWLGWRSPEEIVALMKTAKALVVPSIWYEGFPLVVAEAFATGLPVIASAIGSLAELVEHGRTGLHFRAADCEDLAAKIEWLMMHPQQVARMRQEARAEYEAKYTPERNYEMLMEIYDRAMASRT